MAERPAEIIIESTLFRFAPESSKPEGTTTLSIVQDVGPARALLSLARVYPELKVGYFVAYGKAQEELARLSGIYASTLGSSRDAFGPDLVITAGEVDADVPNRLSQTLDGLKPVSAWLEDTPGSLRNRTGIPDLVFCFNDDSRADFLLIHPDIPEERVFVGANPDILKVTSETEQTGLGVRKRLGLGENQLVVTFIGSKSLDVAEDRNILREVAEVLENRRQTTSEDIALIRRDHPGDPNPELYDPCTEPFKGRVVTMRAGSMEINQVQTNEVCAASNVIILVSSTIAEEISLRGAIQTGLGRWGTLLISRGGLPRSHEPTIRSGIGLTAYSKEQIAEQLRMIQDPLVQEQLWRAQQIHSDPAIMVANMKKMFNIINEAIYERQNS